MIKKHLPLVLKAIDLTIKRVKGIETSVATCVVLSNRLWEVANKIEITDQSTLYREVINKYKFFLSMRFEGFNPNGSLGLFLRDKHKQYCNERIKAERIKALEDFKELLIKESN